MVARAVDAAQLAARNIRNPHINKVPLHAGGHSGPPLRRGFVSINGHIEAVNRFSISSTARTNVAARRQGGMWSGCAGSRTFQPADFVSHWTFGVWQGGHHPRWSKPTDRYQTTQSRPSRMVAPHGRITRQTSKAEKSTKSGFSSHPARSAKTRCIHPASGRTLM